MKLDFIDKKIYFGKKLGIKSAEVAPKTSGEVKGHWVWLRPRNESPASVIFHRAQDLENYKNASEEQKREHLYLLKTGKLWGLGKVVPNFLNRLEVLNSQLLNFFIAENAAVSNTITYSTYTHEEDLEEIIPAFGFVKEEVASRYAGIFDNNKLDSQAYNQQKLQTSNFLPLREIFIVLALMHIDDLINNYDNFRFINNQLIITDAQSTSGAELFSDISETGDFTGTNIISSLHNLLGGLPLKNTANPKIIDFFDHLSVADLINGIKKLELCDFEKMKDIFKLSFAAIPCPFDSQDKRYTSFVKYNEKLTSITTKLFQIYCDRINSLKEFFKILSKFYDTDITQEFHLPDCYKLLAAYDNLDQLPKSQNVKLLYQVFIYITEYQYQLKKKNEKNIFLTETIEKILKCYENPKTINYNAIINLTQNLIATAKKNRLLFNLEKLINEKNSYTLVMRELLSSKDILSNHVANGKAANIPIEIEKNQKNQISTNYDKIPSNKSNTNNELFAETHSINYN